MRATIAGLDSLKDPATIARLRGKELEDWRARARNGLMANQRTDTKGGTVKVTLMKSPIGFNRNQETSCAAWACAASATRWS